MIGFMVPEVTSPLFAETARGVGDAAWERGRRTLFCETTGDPKREEALLQLLEEQEPEGIVIWDPCLPDDQLVPLLKKHRAVVAINHALPSDVAASIRIDEADGMVQAVAHLVGLGRQSLGFLASSSSSFSSRARARGFVQGLETVNRTACASLQVTCSPTWDGGYVAAHSFLSAHPQVDGLICYNDLVAVGALQACISLRKQVPTDVAIVGCDDILLARVVTPTLTTLHVPRYEIGAAAVRLLFERMERHSAHSEVMFAPRLVVRVSAPSPWMVSQ